MKQITLDWHAERGDRKTTLWVGPAAKEKIRELVAPYEPHGTFLLFDGSLPEPLLKDVTEAVGGSPVGLPLHAGELTKTLYQVELVCKELLAAGCNRRSLIVNIGGGAALDFGGFVASIFMRGIPFVHVPTTLLAQVDACMGGKSAVNLETTKNIVGTFAQPAAIIVDTELLQSLPDREFVSGIAEVIKHGLIADRSYFNRISEAVGRHGEGWWKTDLALVSEIVTRSLEIKAALVQADERESGSRQLLNFGHTFGHAVEAFSRKTETPLLHGEAVAIGMVFATYLSVLAGEMKEEEMTAVVQLIQQCELPVSYVDAEQQANELLTLMQSDKKTVAGDLRWTLLKAVGEAVGNQTVSMEHVKEAIAFIGTER